MESLPSIINSFLHRGKMEASCPPLSFLQMLNATTQYQMEVEQEEKKQLQEQIYQHLQYEYDCLTHLGAGLEKNSDSVEKGPTKERKKRKRLTRVPLAVVAKGAKETESQRMNHIAVERNRRKLMNGRLNVLRSLIPSSLVQRSDQASIVSGAIDYIKELEQLLISLQTKKQQINNNISNLTTPSTSISSCTNNKDSTKATSTPILDFLISPQYVSYTESKSAVDVEATVVQGHVNLRIYGKRNQGQLVRAIAVLEESGLSVMHLNITTLSACSVFYSLNLKVEEECKMRSADEIASVVHQIFTYINTCCGH